MIKITKILLLLSLIIIFPAALMAQGYSGTPPGTPGGDDQNYNNSASLRGLTVNIVYTQNRYSDAMSIANILRQNGAYIRYKKTTNSSNKQFTGKILYKAGYSVTARKIAQLINRYEYVTPKQGIYGQYGDKHFNLWITKNKGRGFVNLRNLITNIVYTDDRYNDAMQIAKILRNKGMIVKYTRTTSGNSYKGKILYRAGYYNHAKNIVSLVKRYEKVYPQTGTQNGYKDKHFNLWVTSYKGQRSKSLRGLIANIVYVNRRYNDAMDVGDILRQRGMRIKYTKTTTGNSFRGKILYRSGYFNTAQKISRIINRFERVRPQQGSSGSYKDKHFNIWITR